VALARLRRLRGHEFDQSRHERQSIRMIILSRPMARLAALTHVTNHRDGAAAVVKTFQRPCGAGGVMERCVEREIHFHIPLQRPEHRSGAADAADELRMFHRFIRQGVPMARRRFGLRTVSPEFSQHTREITAPHDVGRIRLSRGRVQGVSGAVVLAEWIVSVGTG
jgi:hypothetical protein